MTPGPFFALQTPQDLLKKLDHDFERLMANPVDSYAAFDFFVTATSMRDWLKRTDSPQPSWALKDPVDHDSWIWNLCRSLSNGGKHFLPIARGTSITNGVWARGTWAPGVWGTGVWQEDGLVIHLEPAAEVFLGTPTVTAEALAEKILTLWRAHLTPP